MRKNKKVTAF